jgi:hypothetical protein
MVREPTGTGGAFLSILEKRDAEALALLRSEQETRLLKVIRYVKQQQLTESGQTLEGLRKTEQLINIRKTHHENLLSINDPDRRLNEYEKTHLRLVQEGKTLQSI